jgi:SAM-dependent methyltransferase
MSWPLPEPDACDAYGLWRAYWDTLPFRADLCRLEAEDFVARLAPVIALQRDWRVLDFGCGFGMVTALLARSVAEICAWDPSASMRSWTQHNAGDFPTVRIVLATSDPRLCGGAETFDLIIVNSVIQYMSARERRAWLLHWRALLAPHGRIVLSDLMSPRHSVWHDVVSLCRFYRRHHQLGHALRHRLGDVGRYWRARRVRRLSCVGREELRRDAAAAGLAVEFLDASLTYRAHRGAALLSAN